MVDLAQGRAWRFRHERESEKGKQGLRGENWNSGREAGGSEGIRAGLVHTQEALGHSRGRHLLPQVQGREKVELFLRDNGRASRFCRSPRAPLGPCSQQAHSSPRTLPQVFQPRSGAPPQPLVPLHPHPKSLNILRPRPSRMLSRLLPTPREGPAPSLRSWCGEEFQVATLADIEAEPLRWYPITGFSPPFPGSSIALRPRPLIHLI